mmetsp:Transcript_58117/g.137008  ORF Transcript_58117/g.137008 Transcript_58117/m.137008 type:complete len:131 (-) Transcript_58117:25-417(-)
MEQHYFDIFPLNADKGKAIRFLRNHLQVPGERVIVCGDSGNDIDMIREVCEDGGRAVVVGNSRPELLSWVQAEGQATKKIIHTTVGGSVFSVVECFGLRAPTLLVSSRVYNVTFKNSVNLLFSLSPNRNE